MRAAAIYTELYTHFANYEYKLNNTFLFDWESDFVCQSKSGYFVEAEVKVSRSDFFVDFKKPKHNLFAALHGKKTHLVENRGEKTGWGYGIDESALIMNLDIPYLETQYGSGKTAIYRGGGDGWRQGFRVEIPNWRAARHNGKMGYWTNDFGRIEIRKRRTSIWAPRTEIKIHDLSKSICPHQFYFAVPEGLIKSSEVPQYAGLIEIGTEGGLNVRRKAPYLHKRPIDLTRALLKKYYNLWCYKVPFEIKAAIRKDFKDERALP